MPGRAVQYYDVAGYLVGRPAGAFTLLVTVVSLMSTSMPTSILMRSSELSHPTLSSILDSESDADLLSLLPK